MVTRASDSDRFTVWQTTLSGNWNLALAAHVQAGNRSRIRRDVSWCAGGDNFTATLSPDLVNVQTYVVDDVGGDKVPRKGGPGVTQSELLIINKIDLAEAVGASLEVMQREARQVRGGRPVLLTNLRRGDGLAAVLDWVREQVALRI